MEQNKYWCNKCDSEHKICDSIAAGFVGRHCIKCRQKLHYNQMSNKCSDKFEFTGLIYFTTPVTHQYLHLNSGIHFRSEETSAEKAGSHWLAQLDHISEKKNKYLTWVYLDVTHTKSKKLTFNDISIFFSVSRFRFLSTRSILCQ